MSLHEPLKDAETAPAPAVPVAPAEVRATAPIDWIRVSPFIAVHGVCLAVFVVGVSSIAIWVAVASYLLRMFAITAFYHRYFSHRAFKTGRIRQFLFAVLGNTAAQRGPIWWAAHHRHHHRHADTDRDLHSPRHGFWRAHMGWFMTREGHRTLSEHVPDLLRYPELRFLERFDWLVPTLYAAGLFALGQWLAIARPGLETNGWQLLVWGFFVSTVVLFHATVTINSLAHCFGSRRYATRDDSRNNWWLALLTLGEGWHNNHHHDPGAARQGRRWWELDLSWYILCLMARLRLVRELRATREG